MTTEPREVVTDLPDVTQLSLADLLTVDNPHLAESLSRIVAEEDQRANIVAGFQSAI